MGNKPNSVTTCAASKNYLYEQRQQAARGREGNVAGTSQSSPNAQEGPETQEQEQRLAAVLATAPTGPRALMLYTTNSKHRRALARKAITPRTEKVTDDEM